MSDPKVVLEKLREQLKTIGLSDTLLAEGDPPPGYNESPTANFDAMEKTLESEETKKILQDEITKLGNAAQEVEDAFTTVSRGLSKVVKTAKEENLVEMSSKLEEYTGRWDVLHNRYVNLVWDSRRVAGNARAIALDFAGDFLDVIKDEEYSIKEKKEDIEHYSRGLLKDQEEAKNLSQGFVDLHVDVGYFREDINQDLKSWGENAADKLNALLDDIEKLEKQIEEAKRNALIACGVGLGLTATAGVLTAIGIFCPILWLGALGAFALGAGIAIKALYLYYELQEKRDGLNARLEEHTKAAEAIANIIANAGKLDGEIVLVKQKLALFASVWQIIHADLGHIKSLLEVAPTGSSKLLFRRRIQTISAAYKAFALALRLYEINVHIKQSN